MTDCTFDAACGGLVLLCDGGVENFRYRIYDFSVVYREQNCGAEILVAFDVRGYSFALFFTGFIALFIGVNS